ncbi:transcription factor kayak isoform X2 [Diorhabda carinulata]|uniref:transcription factor kayak isoform X2 n=1 Tax=Diorhabda sublineata TaxID=1163346 RepID=UPI0024E19217|nr:transcription factor kayak isoform X2 [Diorhabda sublineata]XP_057657045.1 transcription factor kayak isoform X2 [Diorhabda carinulata]
MSQLVPFLNFGLDHTYSVDESDILYNYEFSDKSKMFISLEGLNSGVPTRTTPTLTPTTLRNIEQTFIELQSKPESHENEAGFVPPLVHSIGHNQYISASDADSFSSKSQPTWHSNLSQSSSDCDTRLTPPLCQKNSTSSGQSRRNMGGRKPTKDLNCSPEEEERRRIRRERNKAAAARCRKRRVDHTNSLISETEDLEQKKQKLQDEMLELQQIKEHLEFLLDTHKVSSQCRLNTQSPPDIKPYNNNHYTPERVKTEYIEPMNDIFLLPSPTKKIMFSTVPISKPTRPNTLNVGATAPKTVSDILGGPISTPSSGLLFNFESLMGGGTGLTPVSVATPLVPSCSTQQRNIPIGLSTSNREIILPDRNCFFNFDF